ncbi:MAG: GAF domain-containing protein [Cytophagales bacterium]|nr:MAG: GAF domain-containing protein [Cytophagales bacterium]
MFNKLKKNFQTIKGKTALMVLCFCLVLMIFSAYVSIETQKIKRDFKEYKTHWHPLQLNFFNTINDLQGYQLSILEAVATHNADLNNLKITKLEDIDMSLTKHFDSLNIDFDYKTPINDYTNLLLDLSVLQKNIFERIIYLKSIGKEKEINSDSLINIVYFKSWKVKVNSYWSKFFNVLIFQIANNIDSKADNINLELFRFAIIVFVLSIIILFLCIFLWKKFIKSLQFSIKQPIDALHQLSSGDLKKMDINTKDELAEVVIASNNLSNNLMKASDFSIEIGKGNFDFHFEPISEKDTLGKALVHMKNELKMYAEKEKQANWINVGLANFSILLRKTDILIEDMSYIIISELIKYLNANQGGVFIYDSSLNLLKLKAFYAYERKKYMEAEICVGEGLVGQCFIESEPIYLTDIPKNYISITSGLGQSTPTSLLLVPIMDNNKVIGVIELASFQLIYDFQIDFVKKVAENFASVILNISKNEQTKNLLKESNSIRETLKQQEEEMRQNMEELLATQEEMHRKEQSYIDEISRLKKNKIEI